MRGARWLFPATAALVAIGAAGPASAEAAPPLDPQVVLADLYARTLAEDSDAALILFIARYPDDPLAEDARRRLRLRAGPDPVSFGGPDGRLISEFDAARRAGPAALDAFAARHPGHPLAAEAQQPFWRAP
jgi:hypothetical protein